MKLQSILVCTIGLILAGCTSNTADSPTASISVAPDLPENIDLDGADVLAFGPENVLFIGDSKNATIHAVRTNARELKDPAPFNMEGLDITIGGKLNLNPRDVVIKDMKIHPVSQEAYIAVKKGHQPEAKSVVLIASPLSPELRFLAVTSSNSTQVKINNPASSEVVFWKETPATELSITDLDYYDGFLYVAGLTNAEFASTVRKVTYPFSDSQESVNSIEIYHAVHTQMETRAPIRTMLFDELDGEPTMIASYTCTPLVTIPTAAIESGADVKGNTIAELGYGNAPIDMVTLMTQEMDGSMKKNLLVTHVNRGGSLIPFESVVKQSKEKGFGPGDMAMAPTGLEGMVEIPTANVMQLDVQNQMMISVVRRNIATGSIDLVSETAGVYLRLSDFISEYDFPDYRYPESQAFTKQYHDQTKQMEGYPELVSAEMGR